MRLFAIGDTHLPSTRGKTMDRFGWNGPSGSARRGLGPDGHRRTTRSSSPATSPGPTKPAEVADDLAWLDARPGKKVLLRGNHDFWWGDSATKLRRLLEPYRSIVGFLQNSAVTLGPYLIAGSRLWTTPEAPPMPGGEMGDEPADADLRRARGPPAGACPSRTRGSALRATPGLTRVIAVHFPPLYANEKPTVFSALIEAFQPVVCVYGHLHGAEGIAAGFQGEHGGVRYVLASCDAAGFRPVLLLDGPRSTASLAGVAEAGGSPVA